MAQPSVIIVSLAVVGTLGGLAYMHASRDDDSAIRDEPKPVAAIAKTVEPTVPAVVSRPAEALVQPAPVVQTKPADVSRLIADIRSDDAKTRAAAIEALSNAPKEQAIPALKRVLESGEPQVDRQIALRSLHVLALNDGDDDGAIRDTLRYAMYHSDEEGVTQSAQAFLEDIEAVLAERTESTASN